MATPGCIAAPPQQESDGSNDRARRTWERRPVGSRRSSHAPGTPEYFQDIRAYRYGYETPFIPDVFAFGPAWTGKQVLEIGVGLGIDAVEMVRNGALYTGVDITESHLQLARRNLDLNCPGGSYRLINGDILTRGVDGQFDIVYSFGVLHHVAQEQDYLRRIRTLLKPDGRLMMAVYSKYSFFNAYLAATYLGGAWLNCTFEEWRSHLCEGSELHDPVVIKIRSRREVETLLRAAGFTVEAYRKAGFVQRYLPLVGSHLNPAGPTLAAFGRALGWYHVFICRT